MSGKKDQEFGLAYAELKMSTRFLREDRQLNRSLESRKDVG